MTDLVEQMKKGDRRALSRLLTVVEEQSDEAFAILEKVWPLTGKAITVGITGPAGAGKSTLIDQLVTLLRSEKKKVGVVAIDPSSPFSGGAVLGDRVRMQKHFNDPDVFIRSVGSHGKSGGISFSTRALIRLLDAFGTDVILVETVGAGQSEVDIADLVDTTVVVLVPEAGDAIQAMKAGILEIAHLFVVNKKDRAGAEQLAHHLEATISMTSNKESWRAPIVLTEGLSGEGVPEIWSGILLHQKDLKSRGVSVNEQIRKRSHELEDLVRSRLSPYLTQKIGKVLKEKKGNPYKIADEFLRENFKAFLKS